MAFDQNTRNRLQRFVADARSLLADEFTRQLQSTYGMNPKTGEVADIHSLSGLTPSQQETAHLLRDTLEHYLANAEKGKEKSRNAVAIERIVREQAFTVLNRLAALRMSEARGFLIESLAKGYDSKGFQWFHRISGASLGETGDAYRHYLYSLFDEFSLDLLVLFDRFSVQGRLFPSGSVLLKLLAHVNDEEIAPLWAEDETIGWIYQYFNTQEERKKMRSESQAPRNSRELAVLNQFFTPRYVVEFLTDNTLGRIWYEMTKGETELTQSCKYLVRRPNEIFLAQGDVTPEHEENLDLSQEELFQQTVYIEYRKLKDPRDIRMLDPACGSMHFGLYAFDLLEIIYSEAWDIETAKGSAAFSRENDKAPLTSKYTDKAAFLIDVPRLIIENNIHGVDIDPRAAQIAGLSLWLRAHNSWQLAGIKPQQRPKIQRSNIVCAEPMPGEKALLQEFSASLRPTVLGQLVEIIFEKMELAGEVGVLLKIEQEIQNAIAKAKQVWQQQNKALSQFPDLAKIAKQRGEIDFDVSDIDDEGFWEQAEQKILEALTDYAQSTTINESGQKHLFAEDTVKGFAFIELCRKRFDVVLMNPPFGEAVGKTLKYIDCNFPVWNKNILCAFIEQGRFFASEGYAASVIDRGLLNKSTYDEFRLSNLLKKDAIETVLDLGWGVLDGANVEVSSFIVRGEGDCNYSKHTDFFDLRAFGLDAKEVELSAQITNLSIADAWYLHETKVFNSLPNYSFIYDLPDGLLNCFEHFESMAKSGYKAYTGHQLQSERHFLLHWEISHFDGLVPSGCYEYLYNGGEFCRYISSPKEVVLFGYFSSLKGKDVGNYTFVLRNKDQQKKRGVNFGVRGEYLDAHLVPSGMIFTVEGQSIPCNNYDESLYLLGVLNSPIASRLLNTYSGQHKYSGYINLLPISNGQDKEFYDIRNLTEEAINIKLKYFCFDETSVLFRRPCWLGVSDVASFIKSFQSFIVRDQQKLNEISSNIDEKLISLLKLTDSASRKDISSYVYSFQKDKPLLDELTAGYDFDEFLEKEIVSICLGHLFGQWELNSFLVERHTLTARDVFENPIESLVINNDGNNRVVGVEEANELAEKLINLFGCFEYLQNFAEVLNINKAVLSGLIGDRCKLFEYFIKKYSHGRRQAPIYWPLQTSSGLYTLWIYYHSLNNQTLFTCVNDFVDPKLVSVNEDFVILRNKPSRNRDEEKEFCRLSELKVELEDFRDELLRIAKFWKPNLNDGVQITAAPLWRLFQHKAWQKKLKETWEKLEEGENDWAHLAYSVWPARVLRKCHKDRSLAIAHDIEDDLWHEVEVIKVRKKEPVWEWQPKSLSDAELNSYIQNKIQTQGTVA